MRSSKFEIARKERGRWYVLDTYDSMEAAEARVNDFDAYAWRKGEEVAIFEVTYTAKSVVKANVILDKKAL